MTLTIAIPSTSLSDCADLRQKTAKVGQIARALAIYRVDKVVVYKTNRSTTDQIQDSNLLLKLLRYIDTPQYLRRKIFPRSPALQFAGILPPLRTRSHPLYVKLSELSEGEIRWGIQVHHGKIDIGLERSISYPESISEREPTLFRIIKKIPSIRLERITREETEVYFGFEVDESNDLTEYLKSENNSVRIGLSRKGVQYHPLKDNVEAMAKNNRSVVIALGGPRYGIRDLVKSKDDLKNNIDFWINTIQDQGTETVRLEEALHASLAIICPSIGPIVTKPGYYSQ